MHFMRLKRYRESAQQRALQKPLDFAPVSRNDSGAEDEAFDQPRLGKGRLMRRMLKPVAVTCLAAMLLQGCGWIKENPNTATGAATGAVAGGALGYLFGGHGRRHHGRGGAIVGGAIIGAIAGGIIGNAMDRRDRRERTAQETNQTFNYAPAQGTRLAVSAVVAEPNAVAPGGTVTLQVTYAVMAATEQTQVPVVETRILTQGGNKVAEYTSNVTHFPGTYTSQVPIQLKPDTPKGQYNLTIIVSGAGAQEQRTASFNVN